MIITCPKCSTQFRLNADQLGDAGRNVKCAKCAHRWFAEPTSLSAEPARAAAPKPAPVPPPPAPPPLTPPPPAPPPSLKEAPAEESASPQPEAPAPLDEEDEPVASPPPIPTEEEIARFQAKPPQAKPSTLKWWILLFLVIVVVVGSLFYYRREVVAIYQPMNKLYTVLGLGGDVLGSGLKIPDYTIVSRQEGNKRILSIKGEIKNTTSHVIDVPLLFGAIKDSKDNELRIWSFRAKEPRVLAGESVAYETEIPNPPRGGVNVSITFTTEAEMEAKKAMAMKKTRRAK